MLKKQYTTPEFFSEVISDILCSSYNIALGSLYGEDSSEEDDESEYD